MRNSHQDVFSEEINYPFAQLKTSDFELINGLPSNDLKLSEAITRKQHIIHIAVDHQSVQCNFIRASGIFIDQALNSRKSYVRAGVYPSDMPGETVDFSLAFYNVVIIKPDNAKQVLLRTGHLDLEETPTQICHKSILAKAKTY